MKNLFSILLVLLCLSSTYAQIGIKADNSAPIASAQLEVQSPTKAFYPPRMTTSQRTTMPSPPQKGAVVFDTDLNGLFTFNGSSWVSGSGLTLPFAGSQSNTVNLLNIENTNTSTNAETIKAITNSSNYADAIAGYANNLTPSNNTAGVSGYNNSTSTKGFGVFGRHEGTGIGVIGSSDGIAVKGTSYNGIGGYFESSTGYSLITGTGNVGVGISAPLEKLHVSGNIRSSNLAGTGVRDVRADANGTLITTAQTYTLSIGPTAFSPVNNNSGTLTTLGANNTCYMSVGSTDVLAAPVSLPDGANITSVTLYYINTSTTVKFSSSLNANPYQTISFTNMFFGSTTLTSSSSTSIVSLNVPVASNSPINNSTNSHFIYVFPVLVSNGANTTWATGISIKGVKITYTL